MEIVKEQQDGNEQAPPVKELTLENMLTAIWVQKQLDDYFLMLQSILGSLKKEPFNTHFLQRRDMLKHDIELLQPIVWKTGIDFARHVEAKYGVKFKFMDGSQVPKTNMPIVTEKT